MQVDIWVVIAIIYLGILISGGIVMTIRDKNIVPILGIIFGSLVPFMIGVMI